MSAKPYVTRSPCPYLCLRMRAWRTEVEKIPFHRSSSRTPVESSDFSRITISHRLTIGTFREIPRSSAKFPAGFDRVFDRVVGFSYSLEDSFLGVHLCCTRWSAEELKRVWKSCSLFVSKPFYVYADISEREFFLGRF